MAERSINNWYELLVVGGSAGSLDVLLTLLPALRRDIGLAIIIVLHRRPGESQLTNLLAEKSGWPTKEAEEKETVEKNVIYLAPADYHLLIEKDKTISLDFSEKVHYSRPSIDVTFETAADAYGSNLAALLLSGANADGAQGIGSIKAAGGLTMVQHPEEAIVSFMPQQALLQTKVDYIASTTEIIQINNQLNK
jgi:two-component system chemotaxis response regulator CheB